MIFLGSSVMNMAYVDGRFGRGNTASSSNVLGASMWSSNLRSDAQRAIKCPFLLKVSVAHIPPGKREPTRETTFMDDFWPVGPRRWTSEAAASAWMPAEPARAVKG